MGRYQLGELEELVLLTVAILQEEAYGNAIATDLKERVGRKVSIGSLQTVLKRLEQKGHLSSAFGAATKVRGGKRKKIYTLTNFGRQGLEDKRRERQSLWDALGGGFQPALD
ncbi:MAG: helix-turn-helix transcriptional regulator [Bacteroidota bacterium]